MELKPCPFCQSTLLHTPTHDVQPDGLWSGQVECGDCEARGPNAFWYDNDEDAENAAGEAWNAIATQLAAPVAAQPDAYIVRTVERAIKEATHPQGMGLYGGMARIPASILSRLLQLASQPAQGDPQGAGK